MNLSIPKISPQNFANLIFCYILLFISFALIIDMIYTFSPNWYKPQCLHFKEDTLYYCSNYLLYSYSLQFKQIEQEKCFREVAIEYGLNHKDIKITAI
jgi:hypothetical protein